MIDDVSAYIVTALESHITLGSGDNVRPITVYAPDAQRDHGMTTFPHLAVTLVDMDVDFGQARPDVELFTAGPTQGTVEVPKREGGLLRASVTGSAEEPFAIVSGVSDRMSIEVHQGDHPGTAYEVTIPAGTAWTAAEICMAANYRTDGVITATAVDGRVRIETRDPAYDFTLRALSSGAAYETLGFTAGTYSHLTKTGPTRYGVRKYPTPVSVLYQVDVRTTTRAQMTALIPMVCDVFPPGFQAYVDGRWVYFDAEETQMLDELAKPLFWTAFRWRVRDVWLDRYGEYGVAAQTDADITLDA